jgi:uncharacterized protein (DUF433 family)
LQQSGRFFVYLLLTESSPDLATMVDLIERITLIPDLCNGKPTIRGKRITVQTILEHLAAGDSRETILYQFPSLEEGDIDACLHFAAQMAGRNFASYPIAA